MYENVNSVAQATLFAVGILIFIHDSNHERRDCASLSGRIFYITCLYKYAGNTKNCNPKKVKTSKASDFITIDFFMAELNKPIV